MFSHEKKKFTLLVVFCLMFLLTVQQANAQCTAGPNPAPNVLDLGPSGQASSWLNIAYSPLYDQYYLATHFEVAVYNSSGGLITNVVLNSPNTFLVGIWWNPLTNQLESNPVCGARSVRVEDLDGSGIPLNTSSDIFACAAPFSESMGSFDWDDNEIIYYNLGSIHRYDRTNNASLGSVAITGTFGTLITDFVGYTGIPGGEYIVASGSDDEVYLIDKNTGAVTSTYTLTGGHTDIGGPTERGVAYANGIFFHRVMGGVWYGHQIGSSITGDCEPMAPPSGPDPTISRTNANDPTSFDPCSCGDPLNFYDGNGDITYFHDFVEVTSLTGETWEVSAVSAMAYSDAGATNIMVGDVLAETFAGSGIYRIDLFHPPGVGFTMTVDRTAGGGPFPLMEGGICMACKQIPTLGQWGLILLSLLILTFGVVALRKHEPVLAMAGQGTSTSSNNRSLPFNKAAFSKMLIVVMVGLAVVFAVAIGFYGYEMTAADVPGSLVTGPLLAYLLHLVFPKKKKTLK